MLFDGVPTESLATADPLAEYDQSPFQTPDAPRSTAPTPSTESASADGPLPSDELSQDQLQQLFKAATQVLQNCHAADLAYPSLDLLLQTSTSGEYDTDLFPPCALFNKSQTLPLPDTLFDQYDLLHCNCFMGLLPEIKRAWITIDHRLFLWNYEDGADFQVYEEQEQVIVTVALVKPRYDVLDSHIDFLLALATPLEVILLGVSHQAVPGRPGGSVALYDTQLTVATDGVTIQSIVGTDKGRIFMAGSDSNLYEIVYKAEEGWFSRRCRLVNLTASAYAHLVPSWLKDSTEDMALHLVVDSSRSILYALTQGSHIEVFYLGPRGDEFHRICRHANICQQALTIYPSSTVIDPRHFALTSLHAIPASESRNAHLVAVTTTGVRLYFSTLSREQRMYSSGGFTKVIPPPSCLDLIHVRIPPATKATQNQCGGVMGNLANIHSSFYAGGIFLGANGMNDETDAILNLAPDAGRILHSQSRPTRPLVVEFSAPMAIEGKTWAIAENSVPNTLGPYRPLSDNTLYTQMLSPSRQFLLLANTGITLLTYQRPVDMLHQLISSPTSSEAQLNLFLAHFGADQTCAMCLHLVCADDWALSSHLPDFTAMARLPNALVQNSAKNIFFTVAGPAVMASTPGPGTSNAMPATGPRAAFTARYYGLTLYLSRLLSPLWGRRFISVSQKHLDQVQFQISLPQEFLLHMQRMLAKLKAFLDQNPQFIPQSHKAVTSFVGQTENPLSLAPNMPDACAWQDERRALFALYLILVYAIEAISFLRLLHELKISDVLRQIPESLQNDLLQMQFQDLVTTNESRDLCREIVIALIHIQPGNSVNTIIDMLQKRCGNFCNADDITLYKAMENLKHATEVDDAAQRQTYAQESLRLFQRIAQHLTVPTLDDICQTYQGLLFHTGAVDLALACAAAVDPSNQALPCYLHAPEAQTNVAKDALTRRQQCYERVFGVVQSLDHLAGQTKVPARGRTRTPLQPQGDPADYRQAVLQQLKTVSDPLFFYCLYGWYLSRGATQDLLDMHTPHLEAFLVKAPTSVEKYDLLWKYYARIDDQVSAAKVLNNLAETDQYAIPLETRLEYLSLAVGNARSSFNGHQRQQGFSLLQDLTERLEVAQIQLQIYQRLTVRANEDGVAAALQALNNGLLTVSDLFNDFAQPFSLYDVMLLIFKVSNHHDPDSVESVWTYLIQDAQTKVLERRATGTGDSAADTGNESSRILDAISNQMRQLGSLLYPSDIAFPLRLLAPLLETIAYERADVASVGWGVELLHQVGVPYSVLFEHLHRLTEVRPAPWKQTSGLTFLVSDIAFLLNRWLETVLQMDHHPADASGPGSFPANSVDQAITKYIMLLTTANVPSLIQELQETQRRIHDRF